MADIIEIALPDCINDELVRDLNDFLNEKGVSVLVGVGTLFWCALSQIYDDPIAVSSFMGAIPHMVKELQESGAPENARLQ